MTLYVNSGYIADNYSLDDVYIDWGTKIIYVPKSVLTLVQSLPVEIRSLDLNWFRLKLKDLEDGPFGMPFVDTHQHNTTVNVGGVELARVIEIINGYTVTFQDGQYAVNLIGANSNVGDVVNVNQVSVRSANSAGLVTSQAIEYGEYGGGVHIDVINGVPGTIYPIGTQRRPVNNVPDARIIADSRGFVEVHIIGNITLDSGDDLSEFTVVGEGSSRTILTIATGAETTNCEITNASVTGILDGGTEIRNCVITNLNYVNGSVYDCILNSGTITLDGNETAYFIGCVSGLTEPTIPVIDMNGSGQALVVRDFNGELTLINRTGTDKVAIDLNSGNVILDSSFVITSDDKVIIRGVGTVQDYSTGTGSPQVNALVSQESIDDIKYLVETLRPHHTGYGNIIYWDPINGDDGDNGTNINRAVKTFSRGHDLAIDGHHDIIVCVSSESGQTIVDEHLVITKNYLMVRGPGRDFRIKPTTATAATIIVDAIGVEISGMVVDTADFGGQNAINVLDGADFFFLDGLWSRDAQDDAVDVTGSVVYGRINNCFFSHPVDVGIELDGNVRHTKITNTELDACGGDGIRFEGITCRNNIIGEGVKIYSSGGWGINIVAPATRNFIDADVALYENALGSIQDGGTVTQDEKSITSTNLVTNIWSALLTDHNVTGSFGNYIQKKLLTVAKFLGLK